MLNWCRASCLSETIDSHRALLLLVVFSSSNCIKLKQYCGWFRCCYFKILWAALKLTRMSFSVCCCLGELSTRAWKILTLGKAETEVFMREKDPPPKKNWGTGAMGGTTADSQIWELRRASNLRHPKDPSWYKRQNSLARFSGKHSCEISASLPSSLEWILYFLQWYYLRSLLVWPLHIFHIHLWIVGVS